MRNTFSVADPEGVQGGSTEGVQGQIISFS